MNRSYVSYLLLIGAIIAGHAGYWFLSGQHETHSYYRNSLVIIQTLTGFGLMYWAVRNKPKKST